MSVSLERAPATLAELVATISHQRGTGATAPATRGEPTPLRDLIAEDVSRVVVVGAHPGAGASSVALAIAEAAGRSAHDGTGGGVRLVDAASPVTSGLVCAADRELGVDESGWRHGRRGRVEIHHPVGSLSGPAGLPELMPLLRGFLVVDAGWPLGELLARPNVVGELIRGGRVVLVCRVSVPGVRRAELALAELPGQPIVVGIGFRRWPGVVESSLGPWMCAARSAGRAVLVPAHRGLEIAGIESGPLPKALTVVGDRLVDLLWPARRAAPGARLKEHTP